MIHPQLISSPEIHGIIATLERSITNHADKVSIAVETGEDEAFYIGTRSGFVRLAVCLLRAAAVEGTVRRIGEIPCQWSTSTHSAADGTSQVVAAAECIVETDAHRAALVAHFREVAGDPR